MAAASQTLMTLPPQLYAYNNKNQLIEASATEDVFNAFNAEGQRASKKTGGTTTYYTYEYDKVVKEHDTNGVSAYNVYGTNLISRDVAGQKVYYLYNGHGDVTGLVSSSGTIIASYYYDAFGNIVEQSGNFSNPYRYSSYVYDEESRLYNLNARFYDASIARFMQEDTYLGNRSDPLSLNLYTYCHNNPLVYYDPMGHNLMRVEHPSGRVSYIDEKDYPAYIMNGNSSTAAVIQSGQTANKVNYNGPVINLGTVDTANIGNNTYYNYGTTNTVNMNNGTINNNGTIGTVNSNGNTGTVNNNGIIGSINAANNSELKVYNNDGGIIALIDSGNSDLLVVNSGQIGYISTASGSRDPMNAIMYDGSASGHPSIIAVSLKPSIAKTLMSGALGTLPGGIKSTVDVTPKSILNFTFNSPPTEMENVNSPTILQRLGAQLKLTAILLEQYPNAAIGLRIPIASEFVQERLMLPFIKIEKNRLNIAAATTEFGVPKEIIGSIILKEGFTMSINDTTSVWFNSIFNDVNLATVGLGAISVQGAQNVWGWYGSSEGFSASVPNFLYEDKALLDKLMNDDNFNIRTISVNLLYCGYWDANINPHEVGAWTSNDWRNVLFGYNSTKGFDYADKVMEYFEPMKILLQ